MTVNIVLNCPIRTLEVVHVAVRGTPEWREWAVDGDYFEFGVDDKLWFVMPRLVEQVNEEGETVSVVVEYKDQLGFLRVQLSPGVIIQLDSRGLNAAAAVGLLAGGVFSSAPPEIDAVVPVSGVSMEGGERL